MQDGRRAERVRSFLRAQIIFNNHLSSVDCVVKNISTDGAKLAIDESMSVPNEFELFIPQRGKTYRARMAWRDATAIGVEFIFGDSMHAGAEQELATNDYIMRVRSLEQQNAELKIRIRELSKRLEDLGQDPNMAA